MRQVVNLHAGGSRLRLHFTNRYGNERAAISAVSVAPVLAGPVLAGDAVRVRFAGREQVEVSAGHDIQSDPVELAVAPFTRLAITFYVERGELATGHNFSQDSSYISALGNIPNQRGAPEADFLLFPLMTRSRFLLSGVDVEPDSPLSALVAFGSSTTVGTGSTLDMHRSWPDQLALRLHAAGERTFMSVVNAGIGGNQLTSSALPFSAPAGAPALVPPLAFGEAGERRLEWDVLTQVGATDLVVNIGANDLRAGVSAEVLISSLMHTAERARSAYERVFAATILPGNYAPDQAREREQANAWLRGRGQELFDAVFEFAVPLETPGDSARLHDLYDSGDGFHPNDDGYRVIAEAIDISLLSGSPER